MIRKIQGQDLIHAVNAKQHAILAASRSVGPSTASAESAKPLRLGQEAVTRDFETVDDACAWLVAQSVAVLKEIAWIGATIDMASSEAAKAAGDEYTTTMVAAGYDRDVVCVCAEIVLRKSGKKLYVPAEASRSLMLTAEGSSNAE